MYIVTGGAGFIGSNIVKALNAFGVDHILIVDDLVDGRKFVNIADANFVDLMDKEEFLFRVQNNEDFGDKVEAIFHQGACSDTTEWDGKFMFRNNFEYSKELLHYAQQHQIQFIYASSAAVYGASQDFAPIRKNEKPLNVYGFSKMQFDQYVRFHRDAFESQVVGLRYFNVYGPREQHKGQMSSVAYHLAEQLKTENKVKLFAGVDGYGDGEQMRDFIFVDDVVAVNLWFAEHPEISDIFNLGTGKAQTFNDVARAVIAYYGRGEIEYIPFPEKLKGCYQSYTQADISTLREAGYDKPFQDVATGVEKYMRWLDRQ